MAEINGKLIRQKILDRVKTNIDKLGRRPVLAVVLVGNNSVSAKYVAKKQMAADFVGVEFDLHRFPNQITAKQLIEEVKRIQLKADAVIVQLPLPAQIDQQQVLDAIDLKKDVDCLSSLAIGSVVRGSNLVLPPTAGAVMEILDEKKINLKGKHVVVVGQGELVGKPLAAMLINQPVTLTVCGIHTKNLSDMTLQADVLITGTGQAGLIKASMVKKGAVVIDCGTSLQQGKLVGDVDFKNASKKAMLITPVPGGVGPITVAKLLENVLILAKS